MYLVSRENSGSGQDQLAPPSGQLASASSQKEIKYNHQDWGKPINYKLNNNDNYDNTPVATKVVPVPPDNEAVPSAPAPPVDQNTVQEIVLARPVNTRTFEKRIVAVAILRHLDNFQT